MAILRFFICIFSLFLAAKILHAGKLVNCAKESIGEFECKNISNPQILYGRISTRLPLMPGESFTNSNEPSTKFFWSCEFKTKLPQIQRPLSIISKNILLPTKFTLLGYVNDIKLREGLDGKCEDFPELNDSQDETNAKTKLETDLAEEAKAKSLRCDCKYNYKTFGTPGGCRISKPAPAGYACNCDYMGFWTCNGFVKQCSNKKDPNCLNPSTDLASCEFGGGDCGGY